MNSYCLMGTKAPDIAWNLKLLANYGYDSIVIYVVANDLIRQQTGRGYLE